MKLTMTRVLTPLAALAFTLGAQATDFAKDDFEGQWSNATGGYSFTAGPDQAADATAQYTYDGDAPAAAISPIGGATNTKGLKLSTEDGILFRNLTGANIGDGGLYVDTDVQFTLTDKSDRPAATVDDKFIIWLEADEDAGTTNLCVWAREYALANGELDFATGSNKVYTLDASAIVPGSWHRLTVKAIAKSYKDDEGLNVPGFQVYLDNTLLTSSQQIVPDDDYQAAYTATAGTPLQDLIDGQLKFFPAMSASLGTLSQVGFSGEGKIDDFVVSDNIPSSLPRVAINVTFPSAVAYANLMGTAYSNSPAFLTLEPGQSFSFSMANLLDANLEPLASYSFKLDEGALGDDWAIVGNIDGSYDATEGTVTITAGNASADTASFTIALERSNSASLTLDMSGISDLVDKVDTVSYTVGGVTTTISSEDDNFDMQIVINGLALDDVVTLAVTLQTGVSGVPVFTPSGATGSGSTFTITDNSAEIAITLVEPVAMVGDQVCTTFAEALAAAKSTGYPIELCGDIELESAQAIAANETVTIDLNGHTIAGADNLAAFTNAGTLTITDSSQDHDGGVEAGSNGYVVANTGTLSLEYGAYAGDFTNSGTFTITTDCAFDNDLAGVYTPATGYVMAETYTGSGVYKLALVTYTITYMNGEQEDTGLTPTEYTVTNNVTLPTALSVLGVTLTGWKDALGNDVTDWSAGEMTGDLVLYAQTTPLVQGEAMIVGGLSYPTLAEAIEAATAGDTVQILKDCSVTNATGITFTKGITVTNDYTITIDGANYALRIANGTTTPVTFCGSGSIVWARGSGSPILVGCNEIKTSYGVNAFAQGSFVLDGITLTSTDATAKGGNLVKLEDGTFILNSGTINGGTRGVKADSEGNNATCVLTINGGTIVNTNSAAIAASTAGSGSSTVTVNGGTFTGAITGTGMVTIPGTSTAKFDRDQSAFCASGYETVLSDGWYVVQAVAPSGETIEPGKQSTTTYSSQADAEAALSSVTIAASDAVTNALDSAAQATYLAKFEAKVVEAGEGSYKIEIGLTSAAEASLQASANAAVTTAASSLAAAASSDQTVTVNAEPGFYYSVASGTEVGSLTEGDRTLATGSTVSLTLPTKGAKGFYRVLINLAPAAQD